MIAEKTKQGLKETADHGICPNCEVKIVPTGSVKTDSDLVGYRFSCKCGFVGTVWYKR